MEIDEHLKYTFLQFDPPPVQKDIRMRSRADYAMTADGRMDGWTDGRRDRWTDQASMMIMTILSIYLSF